MTRIKPQSDFDLAKLHLDRFWYEIFWRRKNEQNITVWTVGLFGALLALVYGQATTLDRQQKIILSCFPAMLGVLAAWFLHTNWKKGRDIKRIIVHLNEAIGAWEENLLVESGTLYPDTWRNWGATSFFKDKVSLSYILFVLAASALTVAGILMK